MNCHPHLPVVSDEENELGHCTPCKTAHPALRSLLYESWTVQAQATMPNPFFELHALLRFRKYPFGEREK
jgi:hypothetical protein